MANFGFWNVQKSNFEINKWKNANVRTNCEYNGESRRAYHNKNW